MPNSKNLSTVDLFGLIRINQWVKNCIVFLPMFFNAQLIDSKSLLSGVIAFLSFSFTASAIYCLNDIIDIDLDKNHVTKKKRALASGKISKSTAYKLMLFLILVALVISSVFNSINLTYVLLVYFALNVSYSYILKNIIVVDVVIIALSFVLRLVAGGVATGTVLTYWIVIMVFLLALFLALAKRRDELIIFEETNLVVRKNIKNYNLKVINIALVIISISILSLYILYTLSNAVKEQFGSSYVIVTALFVLLGIVRYFFLIKKRIAYANPTKILIQDRLMQLIVICWLVVFYFIIYY